MHENRRRQLLEFAGKLGVEFNDLCLLNMALTHSSYAHEAKCSPKPRHNERIEFLGDSVLSIVVSTYMYSTYPKLAEGKLTKIRAVVVCESSLAHLAEKISLGDYLLLGKGEELSGGRRRPSILADAFESLLGAIYLDRGFEYVQGFLMGLAKGFIDRCCAGGICYDYKTTLQEYLQQDGDIDLAYKLVSASGPEHDKTFVAEVVYNGQVYGQGVGRCKKEAEQKAAKSALVKLNVEI